MTIFTGTAGFSYQDWKGTFYPPGTRDHEMLEEYARNFPVVEINSTYYAVPKPEMFLSMARRTPPEFVFNVKAYREMTHERGRVEAFDEFRKAVRPLVDHGKLGCVLLQFPWAFKNSGESTRYLKQSAARMEGLDTVVEFRHASWQTEGTFEHLRSLGLGYCCVDEPRLEGLMSPLAVVTSPTGYVRFHGRNAENWWGDDRPAWQRYDYLYDEKELSEWLPGIEEMSDKADRVYVIFNNHYKGQAPANARQFERMLRAELGEAAVREGYDPGGGSLFE
jgi:uncharacterized protein YecE (DUF72 family)